MPSASRYVTTSLVELEISEDDLRLTQQSGFLSSTEQRKAQAQSDASCLFFEILI